MANISTLLDYTVLKSSIWPRMKKLFRSTDVNSVRMACLTCLGKLMENMDKWFVIDEVLPFIAEIRNREPAILVCIYGKRSKLIDSAL
ncbi:unnamed protein product [Protopolystoma xenopodis]|uniref:Uncharacterized protein n=1 Tax=Protopolystoma xenopodis TaxID=117903 RepID=A0A448X310_9PLAT|nr:unnamed protein product [Protopolystoma xenopodis]